MPIALESLTKPTPFSAAAPLGTHAIGPLAPTRSTDSAISSWLDGVSTDARLVHLLRQPAALARYGLTVTPLSRSVQDHLGARQLYLHQARAIDAVREGESVVLSSGTGSGKSLSYQIPIVEAAAERWTSLVMFPTKALAHDQLRGFIDLAPDLAIGTYDGDAGPEERAWVRSHANVILTNPEMLHHGMAPHHKKWVRFLARLRYIVVDELHTLRGIFGSHVGHVLRRILRLSRIHGGDPTFIFCSATIGQPERLASSLVGVPVRSITEDASGRGERSVVLWQPNPNPDEPAALRSTAPSEAARLAASLVEAGLSTIVFCRSRRLTESVATQIRERLGPGSFDRVQAYRSGYLPEERRAIEASLLDGSIEAVVATSALELGVDIAGLDAAVLCGYPGTTASMWQQIGRAGRRGAPSLAVVVAGDDQLDQWMMRHPRTALSRPPEHSVVNLANPFVLDAQIACAAHELPLTRSDGGAWEDLLDEGVLRGVRDDWLILRPRRGEPVAVWSGRGWPTGAVSLRSSTGGEFRIMSTDTRDGERELIGTMDGGRVLSQGHTGAIYLHQGRPWRVEELQLDERLVLVVPADGTTYTQVRTSSDIDVIDVAGTLDLGTITASLGTVHVSRQVTSYHEKRVVDHRLVASIALDLPVTTISTTAVWYEFSDDLIEQAGVSAAALPGALHALEHGAIGILPLFAICDRWDVGGLSTVQSTHNGRPTVFIHDAYEGGAGVAPLAFEATLRHLRATLESISDCPCSTGCPSCVQSPKCGNGNDPLDKAGAAALLRALLS